MPKILLGISSSFCANFLRGQVKYLVNNGYEVVIISGKGEEITLLAKEENATLYNINFTKTINPFNDLQCLFEIMLILKKERPDIVNAGNPKSGLLMMIACFLLGIDKRIFTLHGLVSDSRVGFQGKLIKWSERFTCLLAKKIVVVSPLLRKHALQLKLFPDAKGILIENGSCNGIDLQRFSYTEETVTASKILREKLQLPENAFVMGFVGRLNKDKGMNLLFEAFNQLRKTHNNVYMLLVGPIEEENAFNQRYLLQLRNDNHIFYLGKLTEVAPVYALMDVFVLPSYREGLPNVLLEAGAMEIPMVVTDINGCKDVVQQNINGLLFKKGDAGELIMAIEKYISNPTLKKIHGNSARSIIQAQFVQQKIWKGLLDLYNNMLN
jgi:glycosyltransferase involved in cell wall biosynthesis